MHHSRGVAVWRTRAYIQTDNAHLLCLDARSGHLLWDVAYADDNKNYGATSAPLVVKDKVMVGTSGGDDGVRGFMTASMLNPEKRRGGFGPFLLPANLARKVGPAICIFVAEALPGCPARTIPN